MNCGDDEARALVTGAEKQFRRRLFNRSALMTVAQLAGLPDVGTLLRGLNLLGEWGGGVDLERLEAGTIAIVYARRAPREGASLPTNPDPAALDEVAMEVGR